MLNPGGGWPTKLWSAEKFGALADELWNHFGLHSLVTIGPGEDELTERALSSSKSGKAKAVSVSLKGFCALVKRAASLCRRRNGADASRDCDAHAGGWLAWANRMVAQRQHLSTTTSASSATTSAVAKTVIDDPARKWICMDIEVERVLHAVTERLRRAGRTHRPV